MTHAIPPAALAAHVLDRPDVREALARHDFGRLFLLARKWGGISFSRIAAATGIKPERVGALARGTGSITTYAKIVAISDGLRIPGHLLGLAPRTWESPESPESSGCTPPPAPLHLPAQRDQREDEDEDEGDRGERDETRRDRRERDEVGRLLSHAAGMAMGVGSGRPFEPDDAFPDEPTPAPARVSVTDIESIEHVTAGLRALDYQFGGGACRDAVLAQTRRVAGLLQSRASDDVRRRIHLTLADLYNLAGWTSLDLGLYAASRRLLARALTHGREAREPSLLANVLYRVGRLHLHRAMTPEALRFFQLGQLAAQDSGDARAVAVLCANEAWAYAMLGDPAQAVRSLNRSGDELARAEPADAAPWVRFFGPTDLDALTGVTRLELSAVDPSTHLAPAVEALSCAVGARDASQARSRAFEVTGLAVATVRSGDHDAGCVLGEEALALAQRLSSARVIDRLAPLADELAGVRTSTAQQLVHGITTLRCA